MVKIKKNSKKTILALLIFILLLVTCGALFYVNQNKNNSTVPQTSTPEIKDGVNLDPPTAEDIQRTEDNKQKNVKRDETLNNQSTKNNGSTLAVTPSITYAEQYGNNIEVGAYVNGVFEDNGTCTSTFTKDGVSFVKSVKGVKNVSAVDCPAMIANASEFIKKGSWTVVVKYSSASASGVSTAKSFEVR